MQIWTLLTRSQCRVSDTQVTVKACRPLVQKIINALYTIWPISWIWPRVTTRTLHRESWQFLYSLHYHNIVRLSPLFFRVDKNTLKQIMYFYYIWPIRPRNRTRTPCVRKFSPLVERFLLNIMLLTRIVCYM